MITTAPGAQEGPLHGLRLYSGTKGGETATFLLSDRQDNFAAPVRVRSQLENSKLSVPIFHLSFRLRNDSALVSLQYHMPL